MVHPSSQLHILWLKLLLLVSYSCSRRYQVLQSGLQLALFRKHARLGHHYIVYISAEGNQLSKSKRNIAALTLQWMQSAIHVSRNNSLELLSTYTGWSCDGHRSLLEQRSKFRLIFVKQIAQHAWAPKFVQIRLKLFVAFVNVGWPGIINTAC